MVDLKGFLKNKICDCISKWKEDNIYAVSFLVLPNEVNEYRGYTNVTEFFVGYNAEKDCQGAGLLAEERWNYAFWRQNEVPVIQADEKDEGMRLLFDWYAEKGLDKIGYEDYDACYDSEMRYIGKGPVGCYELVSEVATVAEELQKEGFIKAKFGKPLPIIIHNLEYPWYMLEACKKANPNGEAEVFFSAMKELGFME